MKNNLLTLVILFATVLVACKNSKAVKTESEKEAVDMHNAQNALDWVGTYFGVLPCASCPGINTLITLNEDGTYEKTVEYRESDDTPKTTKGKFQWDKSNSNILIEKDGYRVGENQLTALDREHHVIEGELAKNYILTKTELELAPDTDEGYTPLMYTGSDGNTYNIVYNTNPKIPTALVETKDRKSMLHQTQAWAKGAEYIGNNMRLTARNGKSTLTVDGKTIQLSEK